MKMVNDLKAKFEALDPIKKKYVIYAGMAVMFVAVCLSAINLQDNASETKKPVANKGRDLLDSEAQRLLDKSQSSDLQLKDQQIADLQKKLTEGGETPTSEAAALAGSQAGAVTAVAAAPAKTTEPKTIAGMPVTMPKPVPLPKEQPPRPVPANGPKGYPGPAVPASGQMGGFNGDTNFGGGFGQEPPAPKREVIGDIMVFTNPAKATTPAPASSTATASADADKGKKKDGQQKKREFYLPTSFMEGMLLGGINAPTVDDAKGNPLPVIIRVQAPAILPNEVRADLKGCFVIGEAFGDLSDERVHVRLVSLSCLSRGGEAVIDEKLAGYVEDGDGVFGLQGTVVTKMGSLLARSMMTGMFGGFGEAINKSSQTSTITALGQVSSLGTNLGDIGVAGLGQGIASAADDVRKFYMQLANKTMPVIEVKGRKRITVVVTKGTKVEIREFKRDRLEVASSAKQKKKSVTW